MTRDQRFDTLVIDPDVESRVRLKQASMSVATFGKFTQASTLSQGMVKLDGYEPVDVVFLANKLDRQELSDFVRAAKETRCGRDAAYVALLSAKEQEPSTVAAVALVGTDGMLFEPYSVDSLVEITKLSARVKLERQELRRNAAVTLLLQDVVAQIDLVAAARRQGFDAARHMRRLREMCGTLSTFDAPSAEHFLARAVEAFGAAPCPTLVVRELSYRGASDRVRRKLEAQALAEGKGNCS